MSVVINLRENVINRKDRRQLSGFGGHTIARGRATRWHWNTSEKGDVFEVFRGGADEELTVCVNRDRKTDAYYAVDATGNIISSGRLSRVMADLDEFFTQLHDE